MSPGRQNATHAEIVAALRQGHSNLRIARDLHCDKHRVARIRRELGIPNTPLQPLTLEEKWASKTRPVDGGHLEWTGERAKATGTPLMRYKGDTYSPAAIAFEKHHGRPARGYVKADCDYPHCVAPDHVNDTAARESDRLRTRAERGLGDIPATCVSGHSMSKHAKFKADGTAYCGRCKVLDKRAQRDPSAPRRIRLLPTSVDEAFARHAEPAEDGHIRWTGRTSHTTPTVSFANTVHSAYKIAFRIEHGREPEGTVTSRCDMPYCVAAAHLEDRPMRQDRRQQERRARQQERKLDRLYARIFGSAA
ncbi:hypothetical protein [Streptomyces antibioticus]|uniref:hypothetical protein n=1 Tax=Streptomyces antibioticus TaxID=1890 RepID=UPI0036878BCD